MPFFKTRPVALFLSVAVAAILVIACDSNESYQTDDVAAVPTVTWRCTVQCSQDDSVETGDWCSPTNDDPIDSAPDHLCGRAGGGGQCVNTGVECQVGPPSPAW